MEKVTVTIGDEEYVVTVHSKNEPAEKNSNTGYERVQDDNPYFYESCYYYDGIEDVSTWNETHDESDDDYYSAGNYYNNKTLASNNARANTLIRRLRQWQALNDEPVNWGDTDTKKYYTYYDYYDNEFRIGSTFSVRHIGQIYFASERKVKEAIKVFRDDLLWYFCEYQQRMDKLNSVDSDHAEVNISTILKKAISQLHE